MNPLRRPTTDFGPVRDNRRSTLLFFDVDLTAGIDQVFNAAGNSVYIDQTSDAGSAEVFFQDTNDAATPITVIGGFIARVPFTQLRIVAAAQPGKKLRVLYGVDIDFNPGSLGNISVSNIEPNQGAVTQAEIAVGTSTLQILAANPTRRYLLIQNKSATASAYINLDGNAASVLSGIKLGPGDSYESGAWVTSASIHAIASAAATSVVTVEG